MESHDDIDMVRKMRYLWGFYGKFLCVAKNETSVDVNWRRFSCNFLARKFYALLRMKHLSISCAECSVVLSCGKVDYDKSG
jgi:hypothetical protein